MIRFESTPSSVALRVTSGRQSMAMRSSCAGRRLIGCSSPVGGPGNLGALVGNFKSDPPTRKETCMRLGLQVGYWGLGMTPEQQLELVKEAEAAGWDSVWAAEAYGSDTATVLAWIAAQTDRIKIGSAIFQIPARSPAMTAMTAATLDHLSGGRMILGIGSSGPQVAEGWHGQRFPKQLQRTREYVEIVRKALGRERLEYEGEQYTLPLPDGPGKVLKLMIPTIQDRIPIYVAAIGPKNTQLTGEIADGWLPTFFSPENVDAARNLLQEGASRAGRTIDDSFDIAPSVNVAID